MWNGLEMHDKGDVCCFHANRELAEIVFSVFHVACENLRSFVLAVNVLNDCDHFAFASGCGV